MTAHFDFSGPFPRRQDTDEPEPQRESYTSLVDRLMATRGLDLREAERVALGMLEKEEQGAARITEGETE